MCGRISSIQKMQKKQGGKGETTKAAQKPRVVGNNCFTAISLSDEFLQSL